MKAYSAVLVSLCLSMALLGCGEDNKAPKETVKSLQNVKPGTGGACLNLNFAAMKCASTKADLLANKNLEQTAGDFLTLSKDASGKQIYTFVNTEQDPLTLKSIIANLASADGDALAFALYTYVQSKIYAFMNYLSKGIKADGSVQDYSFSAFFTTIPVKYSIDCTGDSTTFHMAIAEFGMKFITKVDPKDGVYLVESRTVSDDLKKVEYDKGYCIPTQTVEERLAIDAKAKAAAEVQAEADATPAEEESSGWFDWLF